ncbi:MAG TPA: voltage-gated chloride channel family protein [Macromonas sp.]|nr:voltage-gated chloride channel family protein [Macromonas sp.]
MSRAAIRKFTALWAYVIKWLLLASATAALAGSASALFLFALDWATATRTQQPWLVWLLPLVGFGVGWVYLRYGQQVEAGNNLLIDEIHDPKKVVPLRMAPLVLGSTVLSHLFGASVGREGTAVQMGGALADQITHHLKLDHEDRRVLLMAGIAAGFASVFGTPLAGALFGLEVLVIGRMRSDAWFPCLWAALLADQITVLWGIQHSHYTAGALPAITPIGLLATLAAGAVFGLTGRGFAAATHGLSTFLKHWITKAPLRPLLGGTLIAATVHLWPDAQRYLGLGLPVIAEAFTHPLPWQDALAKLAFTVVSLGTGFKGGEVTPLFFIGATLGNALAPLLEQPFALLAALGFVAVFAGAANTPIACTVMALELFGPGIGVYAALACAVSYLFSGHSGIYRAQRILHHKPTRPAAPTQVED